MKTLVLGIGNPILRDDGIGPRIAEETGRRWLGNGVDFQTTFQAGMVLVDMITGYDNLIVIDAVQTGGEPGNLTWLSPDDFHLTDDYTTSEHKMGILQAIRLGESLGLPVPPRTSLLAVEAVDVTNFGEDLTPEVERAIPSAVKQIIARLFSITNQRPASPGSSAGPEDAGREHT